MSGKVVRSQANRLRRIARGVSETGKPLDGVFPDFLRIFKKISGVELRRNAQNGNLERQFKVQLSRSRSSRWNPESELSLAVVNLFDRRQERRRQMTGDEQETCATKPSPLLDWERRAETDLN